MAGPPPEPGSPSAQNRRADARYIGHDARRSLLDHGEPGADDPPGLDPARQAALGIGPGTFWMSVGIEGVEDHLEDLDQALRACQTA